MKKIKINFLGEEIKLLPLKSKYINNDNLAIELIQLEQPGHNYKENFCSLTVNIERLPFFQAAIDTNNFPKWEEVAKKLWAKYSHTIESWWCTYPVYNFIDVIDDIADYWDYVDACYKERLRIRKELNKLEKKQKL